MAEAIEACGPFVQGRRVVTYGFSQGGYGALKYSAALGATVALAFSPQWAINPAEVGEFDRRFIRFYDPALRGGVSLR